MLSYVKGDLDIRKVFLICQYIDNTYWVSIFKILLFVVAFIFKVKKGSVMPRPISYVIQNISKVNEMNLYNASCHCISNAREWNITPCTNDIHDSEFAFGGPSTVALYKRGTYQISQNTNLRAFATRVD